MNPKVKKILIYVGVALVSPIAVCVYGLVKIIRHKKQGGETIVD